MREKNRNYVKITSMNISNIRKFTEQNYWCAQKREMVDCIQKINVEIGQADIYLLEL